MLGCGIMAKCGRCKKKIEFGSRCENCKTKDLADRINKQELNKLDKESQKTIKQLKLTKLAPIFKNYSTYAQNYKKLFKTTPTFDDYLKALRDEKIKLAYDERDRIKRERTRKSSVFPDDNFGREPELTLNPQYPKSENQGFGANAWGSSNDSEKLKPKSNQQRLKTEFGDRAE